MGWKRNVRRVGGDTRTSARNFPCGFSLSPVILEERTGIAAAITRCGSRMRNRNAQMRGDPRGRLPRDREDRVVTIPTSVCALRWLWPYRASLSLSVAFCIAMKVTPAAVIAIPAPRFRRPEESPPLLRFLRFPRYWG
jgi:hypothetical protein